MQRPSDLIKMQGSASAFEVENVFLFHNTFEHTYMDYKHKNETNVCLMIHEASTFKMIV